MEKDELLTLEKIESDYMGTVWHHGSGVYMPIGENEPAFGAKQETNEREWLQICNER